MEKIVLLSDSNHEKAREKGQPSSWYTVVHDTDDVIDATKKNPWSLDESIYEKRCYLLDDCVVSLRPARFEDRISKQQDYNKGFYFLEIANQEGSQIFTSRNVYTWEKSLELIGYFKDLSFAAATRVWKVKKL
ncbi:hypothetical protein IFT62_25090 [Pseudomonas lutea]|uniref:Uncharacterized protein n=1 Tax=Pseudomonas lutea TaxID=243924 RepID=A0ABR9AEB8_9PSED|nr:hypothetical protein [Pseudomonas lutea]MBD8124484.1 hypothetical protein [Pseudomonas lutea]